MSQIKYSYVVDKCDTNILPSVLNSLSKDGFEIFQISEPFGLNYNSTAAYVLVIARKPLA